MTIADEPATADDDDAPGGEMAAFDAFFQAHYASTVRLAHLLTGSNATAEDLAQDAFARVYPRFARLDEPRSYLRTVTVNVCRNWHRSRHREADRFRRHGVAADEPASTPDDDLLKVVRTLSYRQQAVLVLRYWHDLSEADIAEAIGCRPGTVKSLHARALAAIKKELP